MSAYTFQWQGTGGNKFVQVNPKGDPNTVEPSSTRSQRGGSSPLRVSCSALHAVRRRRGPDRVGLRPHGGGADPDLRGDGHHQRGPGDPGDPRELPQLRARPSTTGSTRSSACDHDPHPLRGGDRDRTGLPRAAEGPGEDGDVDPGDLRGLARHRGRSSTRSSRRTWSSSATSYVNTLVQVLSASTSRPSRSTASSWRSGLLALIYLMLYRTRFGSSVRASVADQTSAGLVGINVRRVSTICFGLGRGRHGGRRDDLRRDQRLQRVSRATT